MWYHWIIDLFNLKKIKTELETTRIKLEEVENYLSTNGHLSRHEIVKENDKLIAENKRLITEISNSKKQIIFLDEQILLESYGFYKPKYNLGNSEHYKNKLLIIQDTQSQLIKQDRAAICSEKWTVGDDQKAGAKMVKDNIKLLLRSFNNECEAAILKVKYNTIATGEKRINKAYESLNKLGQVLKIHISAEYLQLKLQELYVAYEYDCKKQEEKEELIEQREKIKEAARIEKELEDARAINEKEKRHFNNQLANLNKKISSAKNNVEKQELLHQKQLVENSLESCLKRDRELDYREQNASAGYVYIISNIGAFGKDIYKIGVTRRLEPNERIDELGNASVPFRFDTHALIFSENAYQLEKSLHAAFKDKRVNLVNARKEFFNVQLDEINHVLKNKFNKHFELIEEPEAIQFRESEKIRNKDNSSIFNQTN